MLGILAFTASDQWRPGIGDPTLTGWLTTIAYFTAAGICLRAAIFDHRQTRSAEPWLWPTLTVAMAALGINKQLDLQTWFTLTAKHFVQFEGWYSQRRILQVIFIGFIAVSGAALTLWMWLRMRQSTRSQRLAVWGFFFLVIFVVARAASFHHVDSLLGLQFGFLRVNHILELGGIFLIGSAAATAFRERSDQAAITDDQPSCVGPVGPEQFVLRSLRPPWT